MRNLFIIAAFFLIGCTKENTCKDATFEYYTNYLGVWNYCRNATDEVNETMELLKVQKETICDGDPYYIGIDTTIINTTNCPRNGEFNYKVRIIVK